MRHQLFTTYMLTNADRTVLYTGVTNNLRRRLIEHWMGTPGSFTTAYKTCNLVWFEESRYINNAIALEKELKRMSRQQKEDIVTRQNPQWDFRNAEVLGYWPPTDSDIVAVRELQKQHRDRLG